MQRAFSDATAVTETSRGERNGESVTTFAAEVKQGWDIGGNANGGYLMALAGRAMAEAVGRPPVTLTAHYLRPGPVGPCEVEVTTVRSGRRFATAAARLISERGELIRLLGTFGEQTPGGPSTMLDAPVELPPYDECIAPPPPIEGPGPSMFSRLASRVHPDDLGFHTGESSGRSEMRGWFAFADDDPIDAIALLLVADAFPPAVFNSGIAAGWVPTVELTVHIRAVPSPGPLRCVFRSRFVHDGMLSEDGEMWDSSGTLVAESRQLALLPRPPA